MVVPTAAFIAGIGPWLLINAIFVQLAALIHISGPSISAVLAVCVQVGTLAALAYTVWPPRRVPEWLLITLPMLLNLGGGVALVIAWHVQVAILGEARPLVAMLATAAAGCCGALSIVQLYPLAARGAQSTTASLSAGMGINGIVASLLALPFASPAHYFAAITAVIALASAASIALVILLPPTPSPPSGAQVQNIPDVSASPLIEDKADETHRERECWAIALLARPGWPEAALQLAIACLSYSLISIVPYAVPTFLRVAFIAPPAIGAVSRFVVTLLPLPPRSYLLLPSLLLCVLWLALFFAAVHPPESELLRILTLVCLFLFNIVYAMQDTLLFLLAGRAPSHLREGAVRLAGAGQQTGAGIGSVVGLVFATLWP